jgi:hypothetical protein
MFDTPLDPQQGAAFLLVALIMPVVIALVKQSGFADQVNSIIALILYAVFAVVGALVSGIPITYENLTPLIVVAALAGRLAYSMFWSQIGSDAAGDNSIDARLTEATSFIKGAGDGPIAGP